MKNPAIILSIIALAGCASTQSVLDQSPRETIYSQRSQAEVAFCLANKNNVPALDAGDGAKVIQIKNNIGAVGMIFSVYPNDAGSRIEIRKPIGVSLAIHRQCYELD